MIRRALAVLLALAAMPAWGAVSSVSGTINNGSSITITGTGFGASGCTTANGCVALWDDFESASNVVGTDMCTGSGCSKSAVIGTWYHAATAHRTLAYSNSFAMSGSKAAKGDCLSDWGSSVVHFANWPTGSTASQDVYLSFWYYSPTSDTGWYGNGNFKVSWLFGPNDSTTNNDWVTPVHNGQNNVSDMCNGCVIPSQYFSSASGQRGLWVRWSTWVKWRGDSTGEMKEWEIPTTPNPAGGATQVDASFGGRTSGFGSGVVQKRNAVRQNANATNPFFSGWGLNACPNCGASGTDPVCNPHYDDVLVQVGSNAQSRIEILDVSTYPAFSATSSAGVGDAVTKATYCTATAWGDTSITCTVRRGNFTNTTAYLYVIDVNGTVSDQNSGTAGAQGYAITFVADGACTNTGCGDGCVGGAETCDNAGSNVAPGSSCPYGTPTCTLCRNDTCQSFSATGGYCGDGAINGTEVCDGTGTCGVGGVLCGSATCTSLGYAGGTLSCASCAHDPSACTGAPSGVQGLYGASCVGCLFP